MSLEGQGYSFVQNIFNKIDCNKRPFYNIPPNHSYAMKGVPTFDMIDWMQDMRPFIAHILW